MDTLATGRMLDQNLDGFAIASTCQLSQCAESIELHCAVRGGLQLSSEVCGVGFCHYGTVISDNSIRQSNYTSFLRNSAIRSNPRSISFMLVANDSRTWVSKPLSLPGTTATWA